MNGFEALVFLISVITVPTILGLFLDRMSKIAKARANRPIKKNVCEYCGRKRVMLKEQCPSCGASYDTSG